MRIEPFSYLRPGTIREACKALADRPGAARILAGGTDLIPRLKQQLIRPACLIDMTDVQESRFVRRSAAGLVIGAGTTLQTIVGSEEVRKQAPVLAEAAGKVASQQIRNVATIGGNLCQETRCWFYNQSLAWKRAKPPCFKAGGEICHVVNKPGVCYAAYQGDTAPALLALDAQIKLVSPRGERIIALTELYSGKGEAPLTVAPDELLTEILIPKVPSSGDFSYRKFSHRKAVDFPLAGVAVMMTGNREKGKTREARLALTGIGPAPLRVPEAEAILMGRDGDAGTIDAAGEAAVRASHPVNNLHHGPPALRRSMIGILSRLAMEDVIKTIGK
jgi:4-hydroxybenzoyl-CoA reductase subunit beta